MRKLLWLGLGIALAWYGFSLIAEGDTFATYRLRDGLIVALLGALLFAWNTGPFARVPYNTGERLWPMWGRTCAATGVACGVMATILLLLWGQQGWSLYLGGSLWGVGTIAILVGILWPGPVERYPAPAFRWGVDAAGNYVRYSLDDPNQPIDHSPLLSSGRHPLYITLVIILMGIGALVRLWQLTALPDTCVDVECVWALRLVEGQWPQGFSAEALSPFVMLARAIYLSTDDSLLSLRWAGAILGTLTLPLLLWASRPFLKPVGTLVMLLVVALLPWAVWSSRFGSVWSVAPLLLTVVLGLAGRAIDTPSHRWWGMTGVVLALLLMQPLPIWGATLGWIVVLAGISLWAQLQMPGQTQSGIRRAWVDHTALLVGSALALGLPLAIPLWRATLTSSMSTINLVNSASLIGPLSMIAALVHGGGATLEFFAQNPLLPVWAAALTLVGIATWLRWARLPQAALLATGTLIYGALLLWVLPQLNNAALTAAGTGADMAVGALTLPLLRLADGWLILLPFFALAIGVAADQLLTAFDRAWSILLPLPHAVTAVVIVLFVLVGRESWSLMGQFSRAGGSAQNEAEVAMGQYLASCLRGESTDEFCNQDGEGAPLFYVPAAAVNHPSTRLLLGSALESGRVRTFDPNRDLLPSTTPTGDLFYLVAIDNQPVIELLRQLYPNAQLRAQPTDQVGPTLFLVVQIPLADVLIRQGLVGAYFVGDETMTPVYTVMDGPLRFNWSSTPPLDGPFNVLWEGTLLVPEAGAYFFELESASIGPDAPVINLQLDGNLVLDSSLGLMEKVETLAQGSYRMTLRYSTDTVGSDWALRWTPPGGVTEDLSRQYLYSPALPDIGLLATYYAGSTWDGAVLGTRKEMIIGAPVDFPTPYSVHWTGKVAAARAGEYFFAITANGPVTLVIDGREVLLHTPSTDMTVGPSYSQASIYLDQGWHDVNLRYAPANTSDLRVLWQPPGSGPLLLASRYLVPTQAPITMSDVPLPAAAELIDARLGDDRFALSANLQPYQPVRTLIPTNLPLLVAEPLWTLANGCGTGDTQFSSPRGLVMDGVNGRIYVADAENRRVVELAMADGSLVTTYALPDFQEPVDVAIDPQGALLVLDAIAQSIFRIDRATGESAALSLTTGFYRPRGFAVDQWGNILVADTGGARVVVVDAAGTFLTQYGGLESGLGQGQPADVLAMGDQFWAIAADHGRLWRLDAMGSLAISERASTVNGPQLAALPDHSGFFMSDPARRTVIYFSPLGQPLAQLGYSDLFLNPMGIASTFAEDGFVNLVVSDSAVCSLSLWRLRAH